MKKAALLSMFILGVPLASAEQGSLRWGADSEGGAPYAFQDPKDPTHLIGFEVDLVDALARDLGLKAVFVQNQWDSLIPGLNRGNYDIVMNGLEITEDRKAEVSFTTPYYRTFEQLTVRSDSTDDGQLARYQGRIVGTLKASLAERILQQVGQIEVRSYDGQINAYEDLSNGRLDAVLMDAPIALYYASPNHKLKSIGKPIGTLSYGIAIRKDDHATLVAMNRALEDLKKDGRLREILERWNLWNSQMAIELHDDRPGLIEPVAYTAFLKAMGKERVWQERIKQYGSYIPLLAKGALVTLELSVLGMMIAGGLGLFVALARLYAPVPFSTLSIAYIEIVRGTPLLIQLFLIFYGLPSLGLKLSPMLAAVLGLGLNYAAYEAENYRAGILSIPSSQMDAALALGMKRFQALRHVIIPQALRVVIPPVTNDFISILKDSSLVSVITMVELTKVYGQLASTYYDYLGIGLLAAAMYFFIGLPFVRLARVAEKRFAYDRRDFNHRRRSFFPHPAAADLTSPNQLELPLAH